MHKASKVVISNSYVRTTPAFKIVNSENLINLVVAYSQFSSSDKIYNFTSIVVSCVNDISISHKNIAESKTLIVLLLRK